MKKYSDYQDEISADELYDGLVGFGLFAEKIPNFLTSEAFLKFTKTLPLPLNIKPKDYIRYSNIRNINIPRPLSIPEPFAYANQCKSLSNNWDNLKTHFRYKTINNKFKISRIHLRKIENKSELFEINYKGFSMKNKGELFNMNHKNSSEDGYPEQDIMIKSKYIAYADISNCFPSIYSHSIAWSLVGKDEAKLNMNKKNEWFNQLDFYTRNIKYGETNGILIGPHSSNLISEIILTTVDNEMSQKFKYVRNIDDYTCYVESYEEAELFFLSLSEELKKYELTLNSKKSKIVPLPQASLKNWTAKLNNSIFANIDHKNENIKVKELEYFLDFTIELMLEENSDASVLNYAIKIISNKHLEENAKNYYLKRIHHLVLLYPYLIKLLEIYVFESHKIDNKTIKNIAKDVYEYGLKKNIYEACAFSIYWALKFDFDIEINTLKEDSINSSDCILMTISFLYDKKHNKKGYLKEYKIKAKALNKGDFDRYWLFIYEALPWSELKDKYKIMKKEGLSFIKVEFNNEFNQSNIEDKQLDSSIIDIL